MIGCAYMFWSDGRYFLSQHVWYRCAPVLMLRYGARLWLTLLIISLADALVYSRAYIWGRTISRILVPFCCVQDWCTFFAVTTRILLTTALQRSLCWCHYAAFRTGAPFTMALLISGHVYRGYGVSPKYTLDDGATKKLMLVPLCCVQNWCTFQDGISDGAFSIPGLWGVPKVYS
jgi:hypothetical protein